MAGELFVIFGPKVFCRHTNVPVAASIASRLPCSVVTKRSVFVPPDVLTLGNTTGELSTTPGNVCCQSRVKPPILLGVRIVSAVFIPLRDPPPSKAGHTIGELFTIVGEGVDVGVLAAVGVAALVGDFATGAVVPPPDEQAVRIKRKSREVNFIHSRHRYFINTSIQIPGAFAALKITC